MSKPNLLKYNHGTALTALLELFRLFSEPHITETFAKGGCSIRVF